MAESTRMPLGLAIGIILMIVLVSKTKALTFIGLLLTAMVTGLVGDMLPGDVTVDGATKTGIITAIQNSFGNTLKSTGIIIGLGVIMGGVLEKSGAAEKWPTPLFRPWARKRKSGRLRLPNGLSQSRFSRTRLS